MKHLIIGSGSIGKRHTRNLSSLNEETVIFDRRKDNLEEKLPEVDSVLVTCPTAYHMDYALAAAKAQKHVFIEKPISHTSENLDTLFDLCKKNGKICYVGYHLRFHKELIAIKEKIEHMGKVQFVKVEVGEYLPGWHPDEDYRKSYAAVKNMGGGVVLTFSHEIDYIRWIFGPVSCLKAFTGTVSHLEIDVEDCACIIMKNANGTIIELHMDYIQKTPVRTMKIQCESALIEWDYYANKDFDRNQLFVDEISHYIDCCHKKSSPQVSQTEVIDVMNIIEKIKGANNGYL